MNWRRVSWEHKASRPRDHLVGDGDQDLPRRPSGTQRTRGEASCPDCGRTARFSYDDEVTQASYWVCPGCSRVWLQSQSRHAPPPDGAVYRGWFTQIATGRQWFQVLPEGTVADIGDEPGEQGTDSR